MKSHQDNTQQLNGVDTGVLKKVVGDIQKNPKLGLCEFRLNNEWINGDSNRSKVETFYAAGGEQRHKSAFTMQAGEPPLLAGHDNGANPVEFLLSALSGCMTTTIAYYAALNGYKIEKMSSSYRGELDLQGIFNLDPLVRPGYQNIAIHFKIKTNAKSEELEKYYPFSPVYDVVSKSVPITVTIETY
jgi:uncharacterized OsmC-like protein